MPVDAVSAVSVVPLTPRARLPTVTTGWAAWVHPRAGTVRVVASGPAAPSIEVRHAVVGAPSS
jgi:hypothetical protein